MLQRYGVTVTWKMPAGEFLLNLSTLQLYNLSTLQPFNQIIFLISRFHYAEETTMDYQFKDIEQKWQQFWAENQTFKADNNSTKPKYYVLDMFPYPSGAGLHVGHPLGYIASDIFARYKRLKGFNVLHPMGYDAFGLPAEQYAIDHGIHPAVSTDSNITNFRQQLDRIGFSFDWDRSFRTSDADYYKWTQWIFLQLFDSWYDKRENKAVPIEWLVRFFEKDGNALHPCPGDATIKF